MTTATKRRLPAIQSSSSEYHKANSRAIERGQAIMSGQTDPGPLTDDELLAARGTLELIPIEHLGASPYQPRIGYDAATIAELAASLKAAGRNHTDLIVRLVSAESVISARANGRVLPKTKYEVLDGHRRLLAGQQAGLPALWCKVVELDDPAARRLCREANLNRQDLKPLERLYALRDMLRDGDYATQADLAAAQGITPAALSNQLRVLELGNEWTELISQEKLTATHLRALVAWKERPAVLAAARDLCDHHYDWGLIDGNGRMPTVKEWEEAVLKAVREVSRPIRCDKSYFYEMHHTGEGSQRKNFAIQSEDMPFPTSIKTNREALEIVDVPGLGERAFNRDKWDELSKADRATRKEQPDKTPSRPKAKALTPAEQKQRDKQNAEQLAKRLYRYKLAWLQKAIVARMSDASAATLLTHVLMFAASGGHAGVMREQEFGEAVIACGGTQKSKRHGYMSHTDVWRSLATLANSGEGVDLSGLVRTALAVWYQHDFELSSSDVPPEFLEGAAAHLGIDFAKEWKLDREFLELHNHKQLVALAHEWKLKGGTSYELMKRPEVIDNLAGCVHLVRLPACLAKLKPT